MNLDLATCQRLKANPAAAAHPQAADGARPDRPPLAPVASAPRPRAVVAHAKAWPAVIRHIQP